MILRSKNRNGWDMLIECTEIKLLNLILIIEYIIKDLKERRRRYELKIYKRTWNMLESKQATGRFRNVH